MENYFLLKEETILEVDLTPIQKTYYKEIYENKTSFLFKGAKPGNAPSLINIMTELRKCCNQLLIVSRVEGQISYLIQGTVTDGDITSNTDWYPITAKQLAKPSGKIILEKNLQKLQKDGNKVLILSQMVCVLECFEDILRVKQSKYERIDGSKST